jgi:hypothetical protein
MQNLTTDTLLPRTSAESGPDPAPRHRVALPVGRIAAAIWRMLAGSAIREIMVLRLRLLLARARGDGVAFRELVERYRAMAKSLGFEGHIAWAEAMS